MGRTLDKGVLVGIGLVVALLVVNTELAYRNTRHLYEEAGWVTHTQEVLGLTEEVLRTMVDAETGQRGFLITGKENFLEPYHQALARLNQSIRALQDETQDNIQQQTRIEELEKLIAEELAWLQQGIDLRRRSAEEAQAFIAPSQGKKKMDAIRQRIAAMEKEERDFLSDREQQSRDAYLYAVATELIAAAVGLALVGALVFLIRHSLSQRTQAAALAHEQREWLHTTLTSIGDAVIVTDAEGRVTLMNRVAQALTGWEDGGAGRPLQEVFRIVNEQTRQPIESPVTKVIEKGVVVGLANHTALIAKDGTEVPIDDSGAPIRNAKGEIIGVVLVFRDVSEQRRLERWQRDLMVQFERQVQERTAELRASEERFRFLVDGTRDYAIFMLDPQGRIVSWNPGAQRIKGYRADEIIGQHYSRFFPSEDVQAGKPQRALQVAKTEGRYEEEGWRVRQDGSRFWASVVLTALHDDQGHLRGFSKITRDRTEKKQAEETARRLLQEQAARTAAEEAERKLRVSEERLRLALEAGHMGTWEWNIPTNQVIWSPALEALHGLAPGTFPGTFEAFQQDIHPEDREHVLGSINQTIEKGKDHHLEYHIVWPDGSVHWLEARGKLYHDDAGRPLRMMGVCMDIQERKRTEQTFRFLAEASAALAALVDYESTLKKVAALAVPFFADWCAIDMLEAGCSLRRLAVAHVDPSKVSLAHELHDRFSTDLNALPSVWNILRSGQSELISEISDSLLVETVKDKELLRLLRELGLKSSIGVPLKIRDKTLGVITFIAAESGRHYDAKDLSVAEELAHRATVAIENARLYREVKEADQRKEAFLATLAHELRNPLAPIRNSVRVMRMRGLADPQGQWARDVVERQVEQLTRLVDDLLDISRISRGKVELRKQVVNVADMVKRAVETTQPLLDERRHHLTVSLPSEPVWLEADPTRLEQILANLLNNSAKYTEPGGRVWLTVQRKGTTVVIQVRDTGIGIGADLLPRVFEMFVQADHAKDRAKGGLGIGLSLVRSLVEMHGGSITA